MFDYCTTGLGYSASAAMRRIRTARCVARYPRVYALLEASEVNLSTVAQVSRILTPGNHAAVLDRIRGKSQREVEAIVAAIEPRAALPPDRVRTVVVPVAAPAAGPVPGAAASDAPAASMDAARSFLDHNRSGCDRVNSPAAEQRGNDPEVVCIQLERRVVVQFSASEAFMAKVEKIRALAWHRLPANASLEQVFEIALDLFLDKEDPEARKQRREERAATNEQPRQERVASQQHRRVETGHQVMVTSSTVETRVPRDAREATQREPIPSRVRDEVYARDGGRCTFRGPGGMRCGSTRALQIDHVVPVARGGPATPRNLRLLCAHHNRLEAERLMGSAAARRAGSRDGPPD
jgi:5-methylcytosine-specific restriction endonuclease McrA